MISNYLYRTHFWFLGLVAAVFVLAGCSEETFVELVSKETALTLRFSRMEQVTTRVNEAPENWCEANSNERYVDRCALLFYDWHDRFIEAYELNSGDIDNNASTIRLNKLIPVGSRRMVVLCNYDHIEFPLPDSNFSDLKSHLLGNSLIPPGLGNGFGMENGKGIPMFGFVNDVHDGYMMCDMYFSVAKIQLVLTEDTYSDWYEYSWGLSVPLSANNIYTVGMDGGFSWDYVTPCFPTNLSDNAGMSLYFEDYDVGVAWKDQYTGKWTVDHSDPTPLKTYYCYCPELQNSTRTIRGKVVDANTFDQDRTCLILRKKAIHSDEEWFYRIDFLTGNGKDETKQFFDILRNRHYVVTVTKMSETGYATDTEALDNPSSNIEYSIDGSAEEYVASNGQYGLGFTQEWNVLEFYEDDVIGKEVTLGYVKAIFEDSMEYKITPNDINITLDDKYSQNVEGFTLLEPDQKITSERIPIKIRLNTRPEGSMGWGCSFCLNLKLGNIVRTFHYEIKVRPTVPSRGALMSFRREALEGGIVSLEDIPDSFVNIFMDPPYNYSFPVRENLTPTPRSQEALLSAYSLKGGIFRYKFIVTQKGKE